VQKNIERPELDNVRNCIKRGAPFGDDRWKQRTAEKLNLQSTLRPRGLVSQKDCSKLRGFSTAPLSLVFCQLPVLHT
jgi:hypothetical protein